MLPTLTVVIPSYRRTELLPPLIRAYRAQGASQIVVVLDGPHRAAQEVLAPLRGDDLTVIELPENVGLGRARIAGLDAATGDIVLAVDDDVLPADGLVGRHRRFHGSRRHAVLLGYMPVASPRARDRDAAPTRVYAADYERQARAWDDGDSGLILRSLWGGNISIPRGLYERAEAYKPTVRLEYNEDLDLGWRLERVGAVAVFDRDARATHHHRRGIRAFAKECVARGGAVHALEQRWGSRPPQLTPIVTIPASYPTVLAALQRHIAERDSPGAVEAAIVALYRGAGLIGASNAQDAIARLLRRGLAMRGYRTAKARTGSGRL